MQTPSFLGIGECMVELSEAESGLLRSSFAGDVFNTLWYASQALGSAWSTRFLSAVGTDHLSDEMVAFVESANIDTRFIQRVRERRPGLYIIHLNDGERSFSYWRDRSAARLLASDRLHLKRAIDSASVIYFSGITLAILPDQDMEAFLECLGAAKNAGTVIAFDPNIRPALWSDQSRMRDVVARAAAAATIALPSFDDEAIAFGDGSTGETVARYASYGLELIVLKDGAGDVLAQSNGGVTQGFPTVTVTKPVDTTGAGDSFNGAFLGEYVKSYDIAAAVAAGQACAVEVIGHHGALIER